MSFEAPTAFRPRYVVLPDKPGRTIAYTLSYLSVNPQGPQDDGIFIVFVNGLGLPQAWWQPTIELLRQELRDAASDLQQTILVITYDRDGQALSQKPDVPPPKSHDIMSSVSELEAMISLFRPHQQTKLFLVAHSIGVPLARLYCQRHPDTVSALLALDSNMANTDFVSLMPDPDASDFDPEHQLPSDTTVEQLRWTRDNYRRMFHPSAPNPERLDRSNLGTLLPHADQPVLVSPGGEPMLVTVVGHDPDTFAEESLKISTRGLTERYMQPAWDKYNEGLLKIGRATTDAVVVADGSGHFVQRDNPACVADEVLRILEVLSGLGTLED